MPYFLLFAACTDVLGPRQASPQLQALVINDLASSLRDGGLIYVDGVPADTSFRLEANRSVPIEISVSSGDLEKAGFHRAFCPYTDRGAHYQCFRFDIYMKAANDAANLADFVARIGGRFDLLSASGGLAGVTVFSPNDLVARARAAGSWPGVARTALSFPFCSADPGTVCLPLQTMLTVPLRVDTGAAVPEDGIIQVRFGDTVTAVYHQPSGAVLRAAVVVP